MSWFPRVSVENLGIFARFIYQRVSVQVLTCCLPEATVDLDDTWLTVFEKAGREGIGQWRIPQHGFYWNDAWEEPHFMNLTG